MRNQKSGRIVNLASIAGKDGNPNSCAYTASKAGVIGFTRGLALEVAKEGIFVNSIAPTMIEGRMSASMTDEQKNMLFSKIPMGRLGKAEEVAALAKFLVSEQCSYSTGFCYDISGGRAVY
jgi:3-oxoacyl-[acyl-carrier protein] reductase